MIGIKPCPYCGGEVEVVKLSKKQDDISQPYRIECRKCHALVARGQKFPIETIADGKERIADYKKYMDNCFAPVGWGKKRSPGVPKY